MYEEKINKLKALGEMSVSASEIAEVYEKLESGSSICKTICEWVIKKAVETGSCSAGEAALTGIFSLAEVVFFPEGEPILVPLEAVVDAAWGATCAEVGIEGIGKDAEKWAKKWCSEI